MEWYKDYDSIYEGGEMNDRLFTWILTVVFVVSIFNTLISGFFLFLEIFGQRVIK